MYLASKKRAGYCPPSTRFFTCREIKPICTSFGVDDYTETTETLD